MSGGEQNPGCFPPLKMTGESADEVEIRKNVIVFYGVNGIGKSSLIREIASQNSGEKIITVFAAQILLGALQISNREELEKIPSAQKSTILESALLCEFQQQRSADRVLLDHHLVVVIRQDNMVRYESRWLPNLVPFIRKAVLLTAEPSIIQERRRIDEIRTGRRRNLDLQSIVVDQMVNKQAFEENVIPSVDAIVVDTTEQTLRQLADSLSRHL